MSAGPILIVEDNAATRKMMRVALQAEGYAVLEAADGGSALRMATEGAPALVLLDCKLPDMDGFEVARRLGQSAPSLPLVAVTGWMADDARLLAAGFLDVLVKPVELTRLMEVLERHVGHASGHVAPRGRTILLADDDPLQRKLAFLALTNAGFEVITAEDGEAALRLAAQKAPDAVVSDILMPRMDGFALCKAMRSHATLASVPIVLVSAHYLEDEDRDLAARFGASRYVSRAEGLDAIVRAVLGGLDTPAPLPVVTAPAEDVQAQYLRRVAHQLERQATIGAGLARRVSLQATALSVLDNLSDALSRQLAPESALAQTLAECLDSAGLSVGAILLRSPEGALAVKAHVGSKAELDWSRHEETFRRAIDAGGLLIPSAVAGRGGDDLLAALGAASSLLVPIVARDEPLGILLLASNGTDLAGSEGETFVCAARSVSVQLGQALALSRMFSELTAAEQRYRALLENAHDGVSISTTSGVLLEVNRRMAEMLGYPREQAIGRHIADFAAHGRAASNVAEYDRVVASGTGSLPPLPLARPDGTIVQVEFSSTVVEVGGERVVLSIGRDVGERLRLEEQLRQSQKMEAVGRLAGGVAHDFNNMLSVILSYGHMIIDGLPAGEPLRDDVEEIVKAGSRAADLTRQLLMFSRQQVVEPKVLDLNEVLAGMDKMVRRILGEDIELASLPGEGLGRVRVDPSSIEQVILNLVVNARDAMPRGGKLTLETANATLDSEDVKKGVGANPGPHVVLSVTDTGIGIDKETQARIFEPFFTTKELGKGTGLGLSTLFGIVQQSRGGVSVHSEPGAGATFRVYLPRVDGDVEAVRVLEPVTLDGSETILLVEDEDAVRAVARGILRRHGYQVLEARNGGEALLCCEQHPGPIDLLVSDVVMPQMSGPQLAKRLGAIRPAMRLLCMSGYTDDSIVRHGVFESEVAYLQKPITPETLTRKVREVLDRPPASKAAD
jgi:PAS domain S-box-containing protein